MSKDPRVPDLRGRGKHSKSMRGIIAFMLVFGTLRLVVKVSDEFALSPEQGARALVNLGIGLLGCTVLASAYVFVHDAILLARARSASGTKDLVLTNLSINSYQQAFDLKAEVIFLPKLDQGVYVQIRSTALALYAGFKKSYGPRMRVAFADIRSIRRAEVQIFGGTTPGLIIETNRGPFELGFVKTSAIRLGKIGAQEAEERYQRIESAWAKWVDQQSSETLQSPN